MNTKEMQADDFIQFQTTCGQVICGYVVSRCVTPNEIGVTHCRILDFRRKEIDGGIAYSLTIEPFSYLHPNSVVDFDMSKFICTFQDEEDVVFNYYKENLELYPYTAPKANESHSDLKGGKVTSIFKHEDDLLH